MNGQEDFYDIPSSNRTPTQTKAKLVEFALPIVGEEKKEVLTGLLAHRTTPNGGTGVTDELKYTSALRPCIFVIEAFLTSNSQVLPSKLDSCFPNRPLGRSRPKRHLQQLGRKGVDCVFGIQGPRLGEITELHTRVYYSVQCPFCQWHHLSSTFRRDDFQ